MMRLALELDQPLTVLNAIVARMRAWPLASGCTPAAHAVFTRRLCLCCAVLRSYEYGVADAYPSQAQSPRNMSLLRPQGKIYTLSDYR